MLNEKLFDIHCKQTDENVVVVTIAPDSRGRGVLEADEKSLGTVVANVWAYSFGGALRKVSRHIRNIDSMMKEG